MHLRELTIEEFQKFFYNHPLRNYCQTINYAIMMGQYDYEYELIGMEENDVLYAASLILTKRISLKSYFAYAPKGFLIDYTNKELVNTYVSLLKDYYHRRGFVFIKINPEIAVGELDIKSNKINYNDNYQINNILTENGFKNIGVNQDYDETLFPTFTAIVSLKDFGIASISKNTRNKVRKGIRMGLESNIGSIQDLNNVKNFWPDMGEFYYDDFYNSFIKNGLIDIITISIDPEQYLQNAQQAYEQELNINNYLAQKMIHNSSDHNINKKMNSDRALLSYKNEIIEATKMVKDNMHPIIAGALIVKDESRIHIIASGYNKSYKHFVPNYYLYYTILNYYKDDFLYADIGGISQKLENQKKYVGLNKFKFGFNPKVYELIGEHDLILSPNNYKLIFDDSFLSKIYKKLG